jgi:alpha-mannosidase
MLVISAEPTDLFVGPPDKPMQLVRVYYAGCLAPTRIRVEGDGLDGEAVAQPAVKGSVEVPVAVIRPIAGQRRAARVLASRTRSGTPFEFTVAEPGWTMYMINHFHYDPVWWNTQASYTSLWSEGPPFAARPRHGFHLVAAHLEMARREPEYKFVLAEVDYLKPYWDCHPEDRDDLRRLIAAGRVEVMGGAYNEPNTNLTSPETTIRNFVHGSGFQRDVMGADPRTAWQLDVFGHDPQFPGMAADAGLTSSSWARGPFHQWGPMQNDGDPARMQFSSEFEWIAPSGRGLLTHYMPGHYSAGWSMDSSSSLEEAELAAYRLFERLKTVALTRNVLLPVGTDYTPPNQWVTQIHRDWNSRYTWPRFVCAVPSEFFAAVRAELAARRAAPSPQTRDMNPIYTGKDVSFIDTKQANRAAENAVLDGERFAVFAGLLGGARYPQAAFAKAWAQLVYGAHHDGITGSESDQVYLDLLTGWRDAWELGTTVRDNSLALLSKAVGGSVVVWNPLGQTRTDIVTARLDVPLGAGVGVLDADGAEVPALVEHGGRSVSWLARDVPSVGWRRYRLLEGGSGAAGWEPTEGDVANEFYRLGVDPARGGGVSSLVELGTGRELIAAGRVGNELALYDEYSSHPKAGEGPWHLLPSGPVVTSSESAAESVSAYRCPLGARVVVHGRIANLLRYRQILTLWNGVERVDCQTSVDEFAGADHLLRLRWPCPVMGGVPVSEVGDAVIGRGFALLHEDSGRSVDTARHPWTLDNPAYGWFGLSSAVRVRIGDALRAVSVAEVVTPTEAASASLARDLMVALVRAGVTATCGGADKPRYGDLSVDSNLPDTRIALGGPDENTYTAAVLAEGDPRYGQEVKRQLHDTGRARVWVPATAPLATAWVPSADLRGPRVLPVLVVAGVDGAALVNAIASLADDLCDAEIDVAQQIPSGNEPFESRTVAVLNRGMPSFAVDTEGTLHTALMRSCTDWPSGIWIDHPRRTVPDGSNFQLQHWTHSFDYALVSGVGDWRRIGVPARGEQFSHPLSAVVSAGGGDGTLPGGGSVAGAGSLLELEATGSVQLAAVKAAGNPLARGSARASEPGNAVSLRLVETHGGRADVVIRSALGAVSDVRRADLLEQEGPDLGGPRLRLHGYEIATLLGRLQMPKVLDGEDTVLAAETEVAQPLYGRYWLHNRGPAPIGGLSAVAHLHPHHVTAEPNTEVRLRLTASSDCTDATLRGTVRLLLPGGWSASPAELALALGPGEYVETDVTVTMAQGAPRGLYPVRAQLSLAGDLPPAWLQTVEDVCTISVGTRLRPARGELLRIVNDPEHVSVAAGESAQLVVAVGTDARADLAAEAHLISPWGTWEWIGPAALGAVLPAGGTAEFGFDVAPPPWTEPGEWWALVRVGCAGRLLYSPAIRVTVR